MKKIHGYLLAGLLAVSPIGGLSSVLFKKDIAEVQAKDAEIDLGLKSSDFIISSGYQIPTSNKWNVELSTDTNPYDYENKTFTVPVGTAFQAHISASDNALVNKVSKFHFSFDVSVPGNVTGVKLQTYGGTFKVISSVSFSDDTATTYSGDLTVDASDYKGYRFRVERKNVEIFISNFYLNSYETVTTANVSFNMQGHGSQVASQTVDIGSKVTQPSNPSATGYTFGGWYKEASCTNLWNFNSDTVSADMTLFAKWTLNKYTVTFDKQSGTGGSNSVSATYGSAMPSATMPTRSGYTFNGYFTGKNSTGTKYYNADGSSAKNWDLTAATTLYAGWSANKYTVTFDKQNGTGGSNSVSATYGSAMPSMTMPTRIGYTFNGYFTGKNGAGTKYYNANGSSALNWNIAQATTLYASWIANTYNVTYQGNKPEKASGTVSDIPAGETWTYDANQTLGSAPTLIGYIFDGWYKEDTCTNKVGDAGQVLTQPNLTTTKGATVNLYAKWTLDPAIQAVIDEINKTKTVSYDNLTSQIEIADAAYNGLSEEYQEIVDAQGYTQILDNAKAADIVGQMIEELGDAKDTPEWRSEVSSVRTAYEALVDKSFIPDSTILKILEDDEAAVVVMDDINAIGETRWTNESKALIDAAQNAYDEYELEGRPTSQIANYQTLVNAHTDYNNVQAFVERVNIITNNPFEYTEECKALIDEARRYFEEDLSGYQKLLATSDASTYYELLLNYENAWNAMYLIDQINDMENDPTCGEKIADARAAVNALDPNSEMSLMNADLLKELNDKEAGYKVIELINDIYPMVYGEDCENAIKAVREAYDALEDDQEQYVVNYDMLLKAEQDYAAVTKVVEEVAALGDIRYNKESRDKIIHARNEYEGLTSDQKELYPDSSFDDILDYETAFEALDKFYYIGDVAYNSESEDKINEARKFYDSLSEEQKALINIDDLKVLTTAENNYATLKQSADILVIILLIFVSLTIIGGIFFLIFLLKRRKKDDDDEEDENNTEENKEENKASRKDAPLKVMSFSGFLPVILISHYVDAPYIVLYVLSFIAILLWISIIVVAILRDKKVGPFKQKVVAPVKALKATPKEAVQPVEASESAVLDSRVNAEGDEVILTKDSSGNIFEIRYIKSFMAKLSQSEKVVKDYYSILKNHVLSYKDTHSRISWHYDAINVGKEYVLKLAIRGKTLCVYLALDPTKLDAKYKVEEAKGKKFSDLACLYRIKNDRRVDYAKELIDMLMRKAKVEQGEIPNEDYHVKKESTKALIEKGLIKESKTKVVNKQIVEHYSSITVDKADAAMSDEKAQKAIEIDEVSKNREGKKDVINIDTLSENYKDGDIVTLESLIEKKLISPKVGYVKVLARGVLDKKLTVDLHDYSLQAVKMIVLMGGHAKKIK